MTIAVLRIHILVVIDEILVARIVRRVDIDDVNPPLVRIAEGGECLQIVALDEDVIGRVGGIADDGAVLYFAQDGELVAQTLLDVFGFVLPHEAVLLLVVD